MFWGTLINTRPVGGVMMVLITAAPLLAGLMMLAAPDSPLSLVIGPVYILLVTPLVFYTVNRVIWPGQKTRTVVNPDGTKTRTVLGDGLFSKEVGAIILAVVFALPSVLFGQWGALVFSALAAPLYVGLYNYFFEFAYTGKNEGFIWKEKAGTALAHTFIYGVCWMWILGLLFAPVSAETKEASTLVILAAIVPLWLLVSAPVTALGILMDSVSPPAPDEIPELGRKLYRGRGMVEFALALEAAERSLDRHHRPSVKLGALEVPYKLANNHFVIAGSSGSGKTLAVNRLLRSAMLGAQKVGRGRFIIYDQKSEILPVLGQYFGGPEALHRVPKLNPYDDRSIPWDLAKDFRGGRAAHLANFLLPLEGISEDKAIFTSSAQNYVTAIITGLQRKKGDDWTLRDLVNICLDDQLFAAFVRQWPDEFASIISASKVPGMYGSFHGTIAAKLSPLRGIASSWARYDGRNGPPFTVESFFASEKRTPPVVLGFHPDYERNCATLNGLLFGKLLSALMRLPDSAGHNLDYTWFFLDEFQSMGPLPGAKTLLTEGRSKGGVAVLTFQDIDGLRGAYQTQGRRAADSILAMCQHQGVLQCVSSEMAEWASKLFGKPEYVETSRTTNYGNQEDQPKHSKQESLRLADNVPPSFFQALSRPAEGTLEGYFFSPEIGPHPQEIDPETLYPDSAPAVDAKGIPIPGLIERPDSDFEFLPFSDDELRVLGLKPQAASKPGAASHLRSVPDAPKEKTKRRKKSILDLDIDV